MGPKGKPGTPKGKKKKLPPEDDPDEKVSELDKEFFLFQLRDIEKKLARLAEREEWLKSETSIIEEQIEDVKRDKGAIVSLHEDMLAAKEEEKCRKRQEMRQLSEEIKLRIENHKKSIEDLEVQFSKMVTELTAKIEELEEEIRILEDYKQNKVAYNQKLQELEAHMNEAEKEHQRNLFKIEKKWESARSRVTKELQSRLLQLSIEFRQTSQKKIGNPCHRVTQENKAIHTALLEMREEIHQYHEKEAKSKARIADLKEHKSRKRDDKDKMIGRTIIQVHVIKTLLKRQAALWGKMKAFTAVDSQNKMLLKKMHFVDSEIERKATAIERVNQDIESKVEAMNLMKDAKKYLKKNTKRLQLSIRNGLKIAEEAAAVRLIPLGELPEEKFLTIEEKIRLFNKRRQSAFARRGRILQYLFDLLSRCQLSEDDKKLLRTSSESIGMDQVNISTIYGKSTHSLEKDGDEKESGLLQDGEDKGPIFFTSLTSLPRSVSTLVIQPIKVESEEEEEEETYEGEFEVFGEEEEEQEGEEEEVEEEFQETLGEVFGEVSDVEVPRERKPTSFSVRHRSSSAKSAKSAKSGKSVKSAN